MCAIFEVCDEDAGRACVVFCAVEDDRSAGDGDMDEMGEDVCDGVNGCVKVDGACLSGWARDGRMLVEGDHGGACG